jgi:rhodanese-related sulfurtransferase
LKRREYLKYVEVGLLSVVTAAIGYYYGSHHVKSDSSKRTVTVQRPLTSYSFTVESIPGTITPKEAYDLIEKNKDNPHFLILDVRTPEEFSNGRLENAVNLDYYSESFLVEIQKLDKNDKYLIYCQSGNRSGKVLVKMKELDFQEVYNMSGGISAWIEEDLAITK